MYYSQYDIDWRVEVSLKNLDEKSTKVTWKSFEDHSGDSSNKRKKLDVENEVNLDFETNEVKLNEQNEKKLDILILAITDNKFQTVKRIPTNTN